ncbi:hypothetical protein TNCT_276291, partial [Trichonephila clavata]
MKDVVATPIKQLLGMEDLVGEVVFYVSEYFSDGE